MCNVTITPVENQPPLFSVWRQLTKADLIVHDAIQYLGEYCLQAQIIELTGLSRQQVSRSIKHLESLGVLRVDRTNQQNVYFVEQKCNKHVTHVVTSTITNTHTSTNTDIIPAYNPAPQPVLTQNDDYQNLLYFGILPHRKPDGYQGQTPAETLIFEPAAEAIRANLRLWRDLDERGQLDLTYNGKPMKSWLIWLRVRDLKQPAIRRTEAYDWTHVETPAIDPIPQAHALGDAAIDAIPTADAQPPSERIFSATEGDGDSEDSELDAIWRDALDRLQGQMLTATFDRYLQGSRLVSLDNGVATVQPPDALAGPWLESQLRPVIERAVGAEVALA